MKKKREIIRTKEVKERIKRFLEIIKSKKDKKIKFIFLFGSALTSQFNPLSDIDVCIYYDADKKERFKFLISLKGMLPKGYDVHIFQDLPLYIKKEVLKGAPVYFQNLSFVHDVAYQTVREWEHFKHYYEDYITSLKPQLKRLLT